MHQNPEIPAARSFVLPVLPSLSGGIRALLLSTIVLGFFLVNSRVQAAAPDQAARELLARLISVSESEPLLAVSLTDARALSGHFAQTHLGKMLQDPTYTAGLEKVRNLCTDLAGVNLKELWPDLERSISGPMALIMLPGKPEKPGEEARTPFELTLLVLTPTEESAQELKVQWPKLPPQGNTLLSVVHLKPVVLKNLPPLEKLPLWAAPEQWAPGEISVRLLPGQFREATQHWFDTLQDAPESPLERIMGTVAELGSPDIASLGIGLSMDGEMFTEELRVALSPTADSALTRVAKCVKENPGNNDRLLAAMPGESDLLVMLKTDLKALGADLPFATQAMERYIRGRKWARGKGRSAEALDPTRFNFALDRLEGSFAISGRPALSGDLRLIVAAAAKAGEVEAMRADLLKGLLAAGGEFETLGNVRTIGGTAPIGAMFQGRGLFSSPVIGLSPGWAWLCSSSSAYQDLTNAFKTGKTAAAKATAENAAAKAAGKSEDWRAGDAVRVRIDLEKIIKLAYAAWLLSADNGPVIGDWKVPGDMLPQPQVFNGHLGILRSGLSRQNNTLHGYSICAIPGASIMYLGMLDEARLAMEHARQFSQNTLALDNPETAKADRKADAQKTKGEQTQPTPVPSQP